jgi:sugar lactone lactonase YvrE
MRRVATVAMSLGLLSAHEWGGPAKRAPRVEVPRPPQTPAGLWISSTSSRAMLHLAPAQLIEGGYVSPASVVRPSGMPLHSLVGAAFDTAGRLWVTNQSDSLLFGLSPVGLGASASPAVASIVTATARSLSAPVGLAFDARHRLWVANFGNGTLVRFDPAQLAASGAPAPTAVIAGLHRPTALAFDASGSLWVSDMQAQTIVAYGADQLEASGTPAPRVSIAVSGDTLAAPTGLAFDALGNLWVVNVGNGTVVGFGATQLAASGVRVPQVTLETQHAGSAGELMRYQEHERAESR